MGENPVRLKLPAALEPLQIDIYCNLGRAVRFQQERPQLLVDGKWLINIYLSPAEPPLVVHKPGA